MDELRKTGRVTIPTDLDVVPETLEILKKWGADAIRDCDGTDFPQQLKDADAKIYSTYYTTRKDNAWAKANPDEVQQCYIMTGFYTAPGDTVTIPLMKGISPELMQVNTNDDITRWWEVMDRTTGQPVPPEQWSYADGSVTVQAVPFHEYTVSFLAYLIWDPVHMYNATTNGWTNFEHQITFDVRQPKTHKYSMERLRKFIAEHPYVNVIRYTTFFHQFTLIFDELKREKFVDWYGYSASVSPYILNQFEQENERRPSIDEIAEQTDMPHEKIEDVLKVDTHQVSVDAPMTEGDGASMLDFMPNDSEPSTDNELVMESMREEIALALSVLNERERNVVEAFYGINQPECTMEEIGNKYGLTRERVRQIREKAIRKLKQNTKNKLLKAYLGR